MYRLLKKDFFYLVIIIILTFPLFSSLLRPGFFPMQDDLQAFRVQQMVKCLKDFQIPCRWIPDMGYQYGYPQFNFYPPSVFYLGGMMNILGLQVIDAVKILFILGFILSAITMYVFLKALVGSWPAFVGAILYNFVPFKAAEVYVRGSLSEFWAFVFFPLIFWSTWQLIKLGNLKYFLWLSVSIGLLLITHNLMSFIFLPLFIIWVFAISLILKKWRILSKVASSSLLGVGLAAFFTLPIIFEGRYVHLETLTGGYFDWRQHFVSLQQLFLSNHFGYGSSYLGPNDDLALSVGIIHWILGILAVIFSVIFFKRDKKIAVLVLVLAALEVFVLFLMHQKSTLIWESIPFLKWLQFPWRFLSNSVFLLSVLGAIALYFISSSNKKIGIILGVTVVLSLILLHGSFFQPKDWFNISDKEKFSGQSWEKQLTISIFDYLPIYAKLPPNHKAPPLPEILDGEAVFINYKKGSNYQEGEIEVKKEATVRLPLFDFPGMEVTVNQKKINHWHNDCRKQEYCLGLITFKVKEGRHILKTKLGDTPIRTAGNIITLGSFLISGVIFLKSRKT